MNRPGINQFTTTNPWTEALVDRLLELWPTGMSAREIAIELGIVSRSAVLGKAQRLGLSRKDSKASRSQMSKLKRRKPKPWINKQAFGLINTHTPPRLETAAYVEPVADAAIPMAQRKTIATLEDGDCRWPVGDPQNPDFHFCGAEKVPGKPYCPTHLARAFQPIPVRRVLVIEHVKETENA